MLMTTIIVMIEHSFPFTLIVRSLLLRLYGLSLKISTWKVISGYLRIGKAVRFLEIAYKNRLQFPRMKRFYLTSCSSEGTALLKKVSLLCFVSRFSACSNKLTKIM
jgi:hypothetical protein